MKTRWPSAAPSMVFSATPALAPNAVSNVVPRPVLLLFLPAAASAETNRSLPAGTAMKIKLQSTLATCSSKQGDTFTGRVTEPVGIDGKVVIPVGSTVQGSVGRVSEPRRVQGRPTIALLPHTV